MNRRPRTRTSLALLFASLLVLPDTTWIGSAAAQVSSDAPAALIVYPYVALDPANDSRDTWIQLSNASDAAANVHCFYDRVVPVCVGGQAGESCRTQPPTCSGVCGVDRERIPFDLRVTPRQPLAWYVSGGLSALPLSGQAGPFLNLGNVPAITDPPFRGSLRCVVVDATGKPLDRNVLIGRATVRTSRGPFQASIDDAALAAIGIPALAGAVGDDNLLVLGGPNAEYAACPSTNILTHYFDGAVVPIAAQSWQVDTTLVTLPCTRTQPELPSLDTVLQFLVFNEFAQRFTIARSSTADLQTVLPLSNIDTTSNERSIFSVNVAGTMTGQTYITSSGGAVLAAAFESRVASDDPRLPRVAGVNLQSQGASPQQDLMVLPVPACAGDCSSDHTVTINEVIAGVAIALQILPLAECAAADIDHDSSVTVDEIVAAVNAALFNCPTPGSPPPTPVPTPVPTVEPAGAAGPDITYIGLASADDLPLAPVESDAFGRPVYQRPFGQGFSVVIEARPGADGRPVGTNVHVDAGALPDIQVLVSRPLGNADPQVCDNMYEDRFDGVPGLGGFADSPAVNDGLRDMACRIEGEHVNRPRTRDPGTRSFAFVLPHSTAQFFLRVARGWAFSSGDTIVSARVRDSSGTVGPVREMVVRIEPPDQPQ